MTTKFRNIEEALASIKHDAAMRAWKYLERELPETAAAVQYLVDSAQWSEDQVEEQFKEIYGPTEEKTMHKINLIIKALITDRDK